MKINKLTESKKIKEGNELKGKRGDLLYSRDGFGSRKPSYGLQTASLFNIYNDIQYFIKQDGRSTVERQFRVNITPCKPEDIYTNSMSVSEFLKYYESQNTNEIKEGYSHFEFTSGSNPYIAKTKDEAERIKRSRGDSAKYVGNINGIDYYKVDDSEKDLFRVDESYGSEKHPEQDMITDALMNIKGTTKVEFDYRPNDGVYRNPENHLVLLVFCKDADIFGDGFDYFRNRKEWKNKVISTLRSLGWVQEDPMEDNDTYLYLVLKKRAVTEDLDNQEVIFQKGNKKIIKDGYGYAIDDGINANRFYVNDNGEPKFDDGCSSKYWLAKVNSLIKSGKITPRKNESLNEVHKNQIRDDEGKIMADRWYASKWPDDEVGIEQLKGITLDDALKDRKILGHCDTQVRERVYAQLDRYIPLSKESPMYKEKNESKSIKESSYKKGDKVELDNGMTGTVTKDFDWENEDQVSVEIDDTKEMRYPRSETLKDLRESYQDYRFDVSCNDDPTKTVSLVWKENDIEGAKEMAKKYYAQEHTTYADDRENKWTIEESLTEDKAVSSAFEFDDDTDDMTFYYEDEDWEEPGVSPRKDFYEDGKEFTWVKRHGDIEHLDFDNWAVWEAYCHDDAESYYFIVDEDTEFIDWGPVDTLEEAQEFLQSKVGDWENDYEFVDNFVDDDLDEGIFDKIKGYGKDLVKGIASQAGTIAKNAAGMAKQAVDSKRGNDLQNSVGGDIFTLAKGAGAEVTTTSDNKSTIIQLPDNMNANDKKALLDAINETGIKYDKNLAAKGMIQIPTSEVKKAQKVINKDKKMQLKADNKQAKAQQDLKNMFSQAGITKLSQLKDLGILSESFGDENAYDVSVYLFPPLTDEDLDMLRAYNLTYLGRNYGPYGDEDNYVVAGNESSLRNYANKYLGYELHPGYLYEYDDFAGEIEVNENLLSEGLQEEPHTIEAGPAVGMSQLLSDLIKDEYEAIDGYNSVIATADAEGYDDMIDVLTDVQAEENVHIGQLQELRKMVDPNAHMVEDGEEEAEEELSNPLM